MSYLPTNPYYAFIDFKVGKTNFSPLPPEHIVSFSCKRIVGQLNDVQIVLFDKTAIQVEYELQEGMKNAELRYGYVNGPTSPTYCFMITEYSLEFGQSGMVTLNLKLTSNAGKSMASPKAHDYKDKTPEQILQEIADEEGWIIKSDSIEPIKPIMVPNPTIGTAGNNDQKATINKPYTRSYMSAPAFIQQVLAKDCISKNGGYGDYKLWFDDSVQEGQSDTTKVTGKNILNSAISSLVNGSFSIQDLTSSLSRTKFGKLVTLGNMTSVDDLLSGKGSVLTTTNTLLNGNENETIEDLINVLQGDQNTEDDFKPVMYFKPKVMYEKYMNKVKKSEKDKSKSFEGKVDPYYRFEWGTGKSSTVTSFNIEVKGAPLTGIEGGGKSNAAVIDKVRNVLVKYNYDKSKNTTIFKNDKVSDKGTNFIIDSSSDDIQSLQNMSLNMWYAARAKTWKATLQIFGDPIIQVHKNCSLLVLTPDGIVHHVSGIYQINSVTDEIQGGSYSTSLELIRCPMDIDANGNLTFSAPPVQGTNKAGGPGGGANASGQVAADANVEKACQIAIDIANDNSHGYDCSGSLDQVYPDFSCCNFVTNAFDKAGFGCGIINSCDCLKDPMVSLGFRWITMEELGGYQNAQRGDILLEPNSHTELCIGNGLFCGAHSNHDGVQGDSGGKEIDIRAAHENYYPHDPWEGILRWEGKK